ncbi:D-alanyl-D-alanine carboxypeptidase/D-alanyl-D-alanine-endopeptidase [Streptomyces sp. NRRL F-5123]|uniref:D-alanyl-D-alanine carboxypeptidase/D-alanyl-D-alanine endopeptidase n=1 Tax=Streptomyces sp. NRRL F-5123 TaxID=1463856 RepID=UPI0005BCD966|nr:D-alanyl-D-alanine carboxypeptidase/D-alanyl-D-alanine-endopeptidase [Streptomyces sp. NRRL F-5123]
MPLNRTVQVVGISAVVGAVLAAVAVAAAGPWDAGQRTAERSYAASHSAASRSAGAKHAAPHAASGTPCGATAPGGSAGCGGVDIVGAHAPAAGPVFAAAGSGRAPASLAPDLAARLGPLMAAPGLGTVRTGSVLDVASGQVLYDRGSRTAMTPASTTKLATAVAALGTLGDAYTLTTTAVATADDRVVLVGGGDPTLTLDRLAADTAAALHARGTDSVHLGYDTSYYSGPTLHPIGVNENLAPVTALMASEGRLDPGSTGPATRSLDPARSAAQQFAHLLESHGVTVTGTPKKASGAGGARLAVHHSAPLDQLVERMLTDSDNDIAEALARQVARASGQPLSFDGVAQALPRVLRTYGVPLGKTVFTDGSGLNRADALSPAALTRLLALAASPAHPELRPVLDGLPIAAFSGTLTSRFSAAAGAGVVRAKTGTLTGVNTIAGVTVTPAGRVLAFAFMTAGSTSASVAESGLDALASEVAGV